MSEENNDTEDSMDTLAAYARKNNQHYYPIGSQICVTHGKDCGAEVDYSKLCKTCKKKEVLPGHLECLRCYTKKLTVIQHDSYGVQGTSVQGTTIWEKKFYNQGSTHGISHNINLYLNFEEGSFKHSNLTPRQMKELMDMLFTAIGQTHDEMHMDYHKFIRVSNDTHIEQVQCVECGYSG